MREALSPSAPLSPQPAEVLEVPPLSVSRAINQEPKTSWVAASPTRARDRANIRLAHAYNRVSTCPVLPVSFTTDSTYQRPSATVHERDASRIPAAFRVPMRPPAPIHPDALSHYRQDALHESTGRTKEERRSNKKKRARERVEALGRRALNTKRYLGPRSRA